MLYEEDSKVFFPAFWTRWQRIPKGKVTDSIDAPSQDVENMSADECVIMNDAFSSALHIPNLKTAPQVCASSACRTRQHTSTRVKRTSRTHVDSPRHPAPRCTSPDPMDPHARYQPSRYLTCPLRYQHAHYQPTHYATNMPTT